MGVCSTSQHVLYSYGKGNNHVSWGIHEYGVCSPLKPIRSLYDWSRSGVHIAGIKSDPFLVHVGLRQSCPLSPVLFIIFMYIISRRSQGPGGLQFGNDRISNLIFTDYVVHLASTSQNLQHVSRWFTGRVPPNLRLCEILEIV